MAAASVAAPCCRPTWRAPRRRTPRRKIKAGDELNYDYGLVIDEPLTPELKADYPCWCGSKHCRGTLLSSDLDTAEGRSEKKKKSKKRQQADGKKAKA